MKKVIMWIGAVTVLASIIFISCKKEKHSNVAASEKSNSSQKVVSETGSFNQNLQVNMGIILDNQLALIEKLAASNITTYEEFKQMTNESNPEYGDYISNMQQAGDNITLALKNEGFETCNDCAVVTEEKMASTWHAIESFRADKEGFISQYSNFETSVIGEAANANPGMASLDSAPGCRWSFYICLAACAAAAETGPVAAAGVYLCACSYCSYPPPGC